MRGLHFPPSRNLLRLIRYMVRHKSEELGKDFFLKIKKPQCRSLANIAVYLVFWVYLKKIVIGLASARKNPRQQQCAVSLARAATSPFPFPAAAAALAFAPAAAALSAAFLDTAAAIAAARASPGGGLGTSHRKHWCLDANTAALHAGRTGSTGHAAGHWDLVTRKGNNKDPRRTHRLPLRRWAVRLG